MRHPLCPDRPLQALRLGASMGLATLALLGCGGGGGAGPAATAESAPPVEVMSTARSGELLAFAKDRIEKRWAAGLGASDGGFTVAVEVPFVTTQTVADAPATFSSTTVQETGVDEDDLMKTDGRLIVSLVPPTPATSASRLLVHRVQDDGSATAAGELLVAPAADLYSSAPAGLQIAGSGGRVAVIGQGWTSGYGACPPGLLCISNGLLPFAPSEVRSQVTLDVVSVANPAQPRFDSRIEIDGSLVGTRRIGDTLYVVSQWTPALVLGRLPFTASAAERATALAQLATADLLPGIRVDGGPRQPLLQDTDCWLQSDNGSLDLVLTVITRVDLASPGLARSSRCIAGGSEALYMSNQSLVVATTRYPVVYVDAVARYAPTMTTDIHKFALTSTAVSYRGSASVPGHLGWNPEQKPSRLSEFNGDLRVLTFTGESGWSQPNVDAATQPAGASPATLTVLRDNGSDARLQVVGQLPNAKRPGWLGHTGEQVYAVRFAGAQGYLVTFRRTDPLYVLDLSNPADPRVAGELQAPGFSDHLFPLPNGLLFGVGRDASAEGRVGGIKVSLFDVSDPSAPKERATRVLGDLYSTSSLDSTRHGINLFTQGSRTRIALPMFLRQSASQVSQQGLQRIEVDTQAGTLQVKPMLGGVPSEFEDGSRPLWSQRSVQIGAKLHWLAAGRVSSWDW